MTTPETDKAQHFRFMEQALLWAKEALVHDEVPVGAVVVRENEVVAGAFNRRETLLRPTAHAEVLALEAAAAQLGRWRLTDCSLYVTLEPCVMCAGAAQLARVGTVVFGARDPKAGAVCSLYQILSDARLNHRPTVVADILADRCGSLLSDYFRRKRQTPPLQLTAKGRG